jgi:hypothetical protein
MFAAPFFRAHSHLSQWPPFILFSAQKIRNYEILPCAGDGDKHSMLTKEAKPPRSRRTAAISFAAALFAAVFSALELHGWHIYIGLAVVLITALYGFTRWRQKYGKLG